MLSYLSSFLGRSRSESSGSSKNRLSPVPLEQADLCSEGEKLIADLRTAITKREGTEISRLTQELYKLGIIVTLNDI